MKYFKYIKCKKCQKENFIRTNNNTFSCDNCHEMIFADMAEIYSIVPCIECNTGNRILISKIESGEATACGSCGKKFNFDGNEFFESESQDSEITGQENKLEKKPVEQTNVDKNESDWFSSNKPGFMIILFILTFVLVFVNQPSGDSKINSTIFSLCIAMFSIPAAIILEYAIFFLAAVLSKIVFYGIIGFALISLFVFAKDEPENIFHGIVKNISRPTYSYRLPKSFPFSNRFPSNPKKEQNSNNPEQEIRKSIEGYGYEFDNPSVVYRSEGYKSFQNASYYIKRYGFFSKRLVAEIIKNSPSDLESDCDLNFDQINGNHYRRAYELVEQDNRNLSQAYKIVLSKLYEETISVDSDPVKGLCQLHTGYCKWESYLISTGDFNTASAYSYSFSPTYKMIRKNNADPLLFNVRDQCGKTKHAGLIWIKPTEFEIE